MLICIIILLLNNTILTGPIWLNVVECVGNESTLFDCPNGSSHDCIHSNNAGVICTSK